MPKSRNKRTRADGSTNAIKVARPDGVFTLAGELIGSFFSGIFRSKAKPAARPKFSYQASLDANINRWTGKPHEHIREKNRNIGRALGGNIG